MSILAPVCQSILRPVAQSISAVIGSSGSSGFSPTSLFAASEQGAWYDPSDFSTMWQDSGVAGVSIMPVTAVGQPVGRINDKSGRGNHATQATTAAKPVLSARVNLLTKSEQLNDAAWTKSASVTVTANAGVAPDGTTTAERLLCAGGGGSVDFIHNVYATTAGASTTYTAQIKLKSNTGANQTVRLKCTHGGVLDNFSSNLTITTEWQTFTLTVTNGAGAGTSQLVGVVGPTTLAAFDVLAWGAQLERSSTATRYQRVNTSSDYDTVGFPHYLEGDGVDDFIPNTTMPASMARFLLVAGKSDAAAGASNRIIGVDGNESIYDNAGTWFYFSPSTSLVAASRTGNAVIGYYKPDNTTATGINGLTDGAGFVPTAHAAAGLGLFTNSQGGGTRLQARIYGVVIVSGVPSKANRDSTARYLAGKCGITL